eukprot:1311969-Amphidinium_carterae.1
MFNSSNNNEQQQRQQQYGDSGRNLARLAMSVFLIQSDEVMSASQAQQALKISCFTPHVS